MKRFLISDATSNEFSSSGRLAVPDGSKASVVSVKWVCLFVESRAGDADTFDGSSKDILVTQSFTGRR